MIDKATRRRLERAEQASVPADPGPEPPEDNANEWMLWNLKQIPGGLVTLNQLIKPLPMMVAERAGREAEAVAMVPLVPTAKSETKAPPVAVQPPPPPAWHDEYCRWRIRDAKDFAEEAEAEVRTLREANNPLGLYEDDDPFGLYDN